MITRMFRIPKNLSYFTMRHPLLRARFNFCIKKEQDIVDETVQKTQLNEKQQQLVKSYTVDEKWNEILGLDKKHNFQKEIIVNHQKHERSTKQLRDAILFEDILQSQIKINIYDTKGRPFIHHICKGLFVLLTIFGLWFTMKLQAGANVKFKAFIESTNQGKGFLTLITILNVFFILRLSVAHFYLTKRYVEKIIYNTQKEEFIFTSRDFLGRKREQNISRYKLIYTENEFLRKKMINYFHIDTKKGYSIIYKNAWIRQDLFSHLIAQRIKL